MFKLLPWVVLAALMITGCKKETPAATEKAAGSDPAPTAQPAAKETPPPAKSDYPASEAGAKALLGAFLKPGANLGALSMQLKPTSADYSAVFSSPEVAKQAEQVYAGLWGMVEKHPIGPKAGQTELLLWSATTDELKAGTGNSDKFPGGYKRVAQHLKPGLTVYRWKFVKPGETLGMAFDGLYNVGGRWVLMPKPWRIVRGH